MKINKTTILMMLTVAITNYASSDNDQNSILLDSYSMTKINRFDSNVLDFAMAETTGDYIVLLEKNDSEKKAEYYQANGEKLWEKSYTVKEAVWVGISNDGKTVMIQGWDPVYFYNQEGTLLYTDDKYMRGYYMSPNGRFVIEQHSDSPGNINCYTTNGKKLQISLPTEFNAPRFYARFTEESKILALYVGYGKSYTERFRKPAYGLDNKPNSYNGKVAPVNYHSYLLLYDPVKKEVEWVKKIKNGTFMTHGFQTRDCAVSANYIILFDNAFDDSERGFYCLNMKGDLQWFKSKNEIAPLENIYASSILINNNVNSAACIYDGRGFLYKANLMTGQITQIGKLSEGIIGNDSYEITFLTDNYIGLRLGYKEEKMNKNIIIKYGNTNMIEVKSFMNSGIFQGKYELIYIEDNTINKLEIR